MDFASPTRADKDRNRWKGFVVNSFVVPERPRKIISIFFNKLDKKNKSKFYL